MMITKKALSRRTVLRGLGVAVALPLLDGMVPALTALAKTAAAPRKRLGIVYVPNGIVMKEWTPLTEGAGFEFPTILKSLEPVRDKVLVLSGLNNEAGSGGFHPRASAAFLTGLSPARSTGNTALRLGISMDQLAANVLGQETQVPSLELALEGVDSNVVAVCDPGFSCAYTNISWRNETTPMPRETNPRMVFERLFGDSGSTDPAVRLGRIRRRSSILDSVAGKVHDLQRGLATSDRVKLDSYLEAVRDIERRLQTAEQQGTREMPLFDSPAGIPVTYDEHAKLMFDLQVLAYQTDLTRVISFMFGRELSGATYPQIGVNDAHHPITHHLDEAANVVKVTKINSYHMSLFADYVKKLAATPDGDGTLLDNIVILYGSPLADGNRHSVENLPIALIGGGAGTLKSGRHITYGSAPSGAPPSPGSPGFGGYRKLAGTVLPNLHLTLLDQLGVQVDHLGNSTGKLELLSEIS